MPRTLLLIAMLVAPLAAVAEVTVSDAWIREAPPSARTMAGYMVLHNDGARPRALVGAKADGFARAMVHQTLEQDGIAKMVHRMRVDIAAHGRVEFAPGGYHLMLMKPARRLVAGDHVPVTLRFADGGELALDFEVRRIR